MDRIPYKMVGERDGRLKMLERGFICGSGLNLFHQDLLKSDPGAD